MLFKQIHIFSSKNRQNAENPLGKRVSAFCFVISATLLQHFYIFFCCGGTRFSKRNFIMQLRLYYRFLFAKKQLWRYNNLLLLFYFEVEFYEKLEAYSGYPHG